MTKTSKQKKGVKLLKHMEKVGGLTHKQIVQFLLRGTGKKYGPATRTTYDSYLYGTFTREGLLARFCSKDYGQDEYRVIHSDYDTYTLTGLRY